ncbi:MAG: hypothetical protein AB8H86_04300 [Polyangiales bacterium]
MTTPRPNDEQVSDSKKSEPLTDQIADKIRGGLQQIAEKLSEFMAPEPKLVPVRVRRPSPPRRRRRY